MTSLTADEGLREQGLDPVLGNLDLLRLVDLVQLCIDPLCTAVLDQGIHILVSLAE